MLVRLGLPAFLCVIRASPGIQIYLRGELDSGFRRNDAGLASRDCPSQKIHTLVR